MYSIAMAISPDGFSKTPWHWTTKGESVQQRISISRKTWRQRKVPPFPWPRTCSLSKSAHVMVAVAAAELPEGAAAGGRGKGKRGQRSDSGKGSCRFNCLRCLTTAINTTKSFQFRFQKKPQLLEMAVVFGDLNSASGLKKLDEYLLTRSYITRVPSFKGRYYSLCSSFKGTVV
ncbi:hypothetical protein Patl1_32960 [Pistacia atlantica]|uniref:Uncharacterized protein n=1 Tax=Pistacia atlantica TaxID=434234 RepID=A0ACC1ARG6_9ROSI|nr:hypothetical protein Patl1_32960 [Pistacia atlantica]